MSDFQVGDRVSVEGFVCEISPEHSANKDAGYVLVKIGSQRGGVFIDPRFVTLVERPRRKLRVGSVWEHYNVRYVVVPDEYTGRGLVKLTQLGTGETMMTAAHIHARPDLWREVPVEELEREATT